MCPGGRNSSRTFSTATCGEPSSRTTNADKHDPDENRASGGSVSSGSCLYLSELYSGSTHRNRSHGNRHQVPRLRAHETVRRWRTRNVPQVRGHHGRAQEEVSGEIDLARRRSTRQNEDEI